MAKSNHEIEIEFDDDTQKYLVTWKLPIAIGTGKTEAEALQDLREAAHLYVDTLIESGRGKTRQTDKDGKNSDTTSQATIREKAREIVGYLPGKNCGKCGFANCGEFAVAVAEGKATISDCRGVHRGDYRVDESMKGHPEETLSGYPLHARSEISAGTGPVQGKRHPHGFFRHGHRAHDFARSKHKGHHFSGGRGPRRCRQAP